MADIDIVRKERSNLWIWIVLAIVVLIALYFLFGRAPSGSRVGAIAGEPLTVAAASAVVSSIG